MHSSGYLPAPIHHQGDYVSPTLSRPEARHMSGQAQSYDELATLKARLQEMRANVSRYGDNAYDNAERQRLKAEIAQLELRGGQPHGGPASDEVQRLRWENADLREQLSRCQKLLHGEVAQHQATREKLRAVEARLPYQAAAVAAQPISQGYVHPYQTQAHQYQQQAAFPPSINVHVAASPSVAAPQHSVPYLNGTYNLTVASTGAKGRSFMSCRRQGDYVDVFTKDTGTGRQRWVLSDRGGYYHITVSGGCDRGREYLSCTNGGKVDLFSNDDGSGRQRWRIVDAPRGTYNIIVAGGTKGGKLFLGCDSGGATLKLTPRDDGSGRQRWKLKEVSSQSASQGPQFSGRIITKTAAQGTVLKPGDAIVSMNGKYSATLTDSGQLVCLDAATGAQFWASRAGSAPGPYHCKVQADGNLCVYDSRGCAWASKSSDFHRKGCYLVMQDDRNLVLYTKWPKGKALWATGTHKK